MRRTAFDHEYRQMYGRYPDVDTKFEPPPEPEEIPFRWSDLSVSDQLWIYLSIALGFVGLVIVAGFIFLLVALVRGG